jgi:hypothetical protein
MNVPGISRPAAALAALLLSLPLAQADQYSYEPIEATSAIQRDGRDLEPYKQYDATIQTRIDHVLIRKEQEAKQVQVLVCDQGNGTEGDWKNFFNVPKPQKARALADAVLGIGLPTAERIVELNLLDHKPRSWDEFKRLMKRIDDDYLQTGFSHEVTVTYGRENMRNLGYDTGNCHYEWKTEYYWVEKKYVIGSIPARKDFRVEIRDSILLRGESERITLSYNGLQDSLKDVDSSYNRYRSSRVEEQGRVTYRLQGERIRATPPNHAVIRLAKEGGRVAAELTDSDYDDELPGAGRTFVTVEIYKKVFLWPDKLLGSFQLELVGGRARTLSDVVPPAGSKVYATYSLQKAGSAYYSTQSSAKQRSVGDLQF